MKSQSVVTLNLEINGDKTTELVKTFESLKDFKFAHVAKNIGNVVITRVPANLQDEVSRYIFKGINLYLIDKEKRELFRRIFK